MKFNPITQDLFTDQDEWIKQLKCPYRVQWDDLKVDGATQRSCDICDHRVAETARLDDETLLYMVRQNSRMCLKIDLDQDNLQIVEQ